MRTLRRLIGLVSMLLFIGAIVKELGKELEKRTGLGTIADLVPYDFRFPSVEKLQATFWNPQGRVIVGTAFGVGWTINVGRLARLAGLA